MKNFKVIKLNSRIDERGWAVRPFNDGELKSGDISDLHVVSLKPGHVRGNHYHRFRSEYIWVLNGVTELTTVNNEKDEKEGMVIDGDKENIMVHIPPDVTHAFKNVGTTVAYLFCASDRHVGSEGSDIVRNEIVNRKAARNGSGGE